MVGVRDGMNMLNDVANDKSMPKEVRVHATGYLCMCGQIQLMSHSLHNVLRSMLDETQETEA